MMAVTACEDNGDLANIPALPGNLDVEPHVLFYVAHIILTLVTVYLILDHWFQWFTHCLRIKWHFRLTIDISLSVDSDTKYNVELRIDDLRADKQPPTEVDGINFATKQYCAKSFDDGSNFNEGAFSSSGYGSGYATSSSNYSEQSFRSKIVGGGSVKITRSMLKGTESVADKGHDVYRHSVKMPQESSPQDDCRDNSFRAVMHGEPKAKRTGNYHSTYTSKQKDASAVLKLTQKESSVYIQDASSELSKRQIENGPMKLQQETQRDSGFPTGHGYNKASYAVVVGNSVKLYSTNLFASLPHHNKFLVKEKLQDVFGVTRVRLTLKQSIETTGHSNVSKYIPDEDVEKDGVEKYTEKTHYRENLKCTGYVIFTCDRRFSGNVKYPLPSSKAIDFKIGKGGNGFVFTIYHERKQYAVKKTIYRPNEINVHSALKHENILPLVAVLMGEKHERHSGKFYCFHFMPKMDYDLRQILSTKEVGCLKHFYNHCSAHNDHSKWDTAYKNIKFILKETLKALAYLHNSGYVHRDVKASNIMIKLRCQCQPLSCICRTKFQVKLGDFDSAGTIPGLGITEPTDQMIKFASILPLGTPGYRAPEVSMHITLSGPYETLYTTAVDIWSFGCLCLNICIGKTAALKQREEASLLLSLTHPTCSQELWEKTTKIKELEKSKPFSHDLMLIKLVRGCLQVQSVRRPKAEEAIQLFHATS